MFWKRYNFTNKKPFISIPVGQCIHYCAYQYKSSNPPPYEQYIRFLNLEDKKSARAYFIDYLRHYRPNNMQDALGITNSSVRSSLWSYPWDIDNPGIYYNLEKGWYEDPNQIPDIMTHFSNKGILSFRIEEEFCWLESAYYNIKKYGFDNRLSNDPCRFLCLMNKHGDSRYIVENGNHRLSVLAVLDQDVVSGYITRKIYESRAMEWPAVKSGIVSLKDALKIFMAYFNPKLHYKTTNIGAEIIGNFI